MDQLDDNKIDLMKTMVGKATQDLLKGTLDVLFFDCTTLYFESFKEDDLKQNGYSKDCKFNQPQVLLALMVTHDGLPVTYEVFPGAKFEGHSFIPVLEGLRKKYDLRQAVCVADRGMLNEANLQELEAAGAHYVVGAKLKQLPRSKQQQVLGRSAYREEGKNGRQILELSHDNRSTIVTYCPVRAEKDRHDRQEALDRLLKKIGKSDNPKNLLNNYGYKKFLVIKGKTKLGVDTEKVEAAALWDGLHGVVTNLPEMAATEVLNQYRGLWQVEETFRISKHDLKIRPIYHWTPRRVRAHIALSFMALACVRHLTYRIQLQYRRLSPQCIRNALLHVQHSVLKDQKTGRRYDIPSQVSQEAEKIYQFMGLPLTLTPFELG